MNRLEEEMLKLVKKYHSGQYRNNGRVPYWHHCLSVAEIFSATVFISKEFTAKKFKDLYLCALGHDLYEDTKIKKELIVKKFGITVDYYIDCLTNEVSDTDRIGYLKKIKNSPEEVLLIKMAVGD